MHYSKLPCRSDPQRESSPEDARVHCAVLKIRTEPCVPASHTGTGAAGRSRYQP